MRARVFWLAFFRFILLVVSLATIACHIGSPYRTKYFMPWILRNKCDITMKYSPGGDAQELCWPEEHQPLVSDELCACEFKGKRDRPHHEN